MATYSAGQLVTSAEINANICKLLAARGSTASATVTTSVADLDGCTLTFSTPEANTKVLVTGSFDAEISAAGDTFTGILDVDGSDQTAKAQLNGDARATVVQQWLITLASAGSHTLKLQVQKSGTANTVTIYSGSYISIVGNGLT